MSSKDIFGFGEALPAPSVPDDILAADDKTLRLAAPWVDAERVEGFIRYQQALAAKLRAGAQLAEAHTAALSEGGLEVANHAQVAAFVNDFCGRRTTVRTLRRKLTERQIRAATIEAEGGDVPADEQDLLARLATEIARLDTLVPLERRYGREAVALVAGREDDLVVLHAEVAALVNRR